MRGRVGVARTLSAVTPGPITPHCLVDQQEHIRCGAKKNAGKTKKQADHLPSHEQAQGPILAGCIDDHSLDALTMLVCKRNLKRLLYRVPRIALPPFVLADHHPNRQFSHLQVVVFRALRACQIHKTNYASMRRGCVESPVRHWDRLGRTGRPWNSRWRSPSPLILTPVWDSHRCGFHVVFFYV